MVDDNQKEIIFPCKVMFSELGWKYFGQKQRYPVKDRVGIALGVAKGRYYRGYIRVKWDDRKSIQYYPASNIHFLTS